MTAPPDQPQAAMTAEEIAALREELDEDYCVANPALAWSRLLDIAADHARLLDELERGEREFKEALAAMEEQRKLNRQFYAQTIGEERARAETAEAQVEAGAAEIERLKGERDAWAKECREARGLYVDAEARLAAVQEGWRLVPVEPTTDMMAAGLDPLRTENVKDSSENGRCGRIWSAMVAAAAPPPAAKEG